MLNIFNSNICANIMGHLFTKVRSVQKQKSITTSAIKEYSWDKKTSLPCDDFVLRKLENDEKLKLPGTVNGEQIVIENCTESIIFILDYINTVTVDECINCKIVLGPVKRSIFLRDCHNCTIMVACEQFRIRDCSNLNVSLYCATQPIIESSTNILFTCYQLYYKHIYEHFKECNLNIWNNFWYKIHDYTPSNSSDIPNWNYWKVELKSFPIPIESKYTLIYDPMNSAIPLTRGIILKTDNLSDSCLVVFCDDFSAREFLNFIIDSRLNLILIRTRQINLSTQHAESLFLTTSMVKALEYGPVIGLHLHGQNVLNICSQLIQEKLETSLYYVSPTSNIASHQVNTFFGFIDL